MTQPIADICLITEGSYPYVSGGVSGWCQQLIEDHQDKTFHLVSIVSMTQELKHRYTLPKNVIGLQNIVLQSLPKVSSFKSFKKRKAFFSQLEANLKDFFISGGTKAFKNLIDLLEAYPMAFSEEILLNSQESWDILLTFYKRYMPGASFIDFFWAWRNLFSSLFSIIASPLPPARLYHAACTGYAGLLMAKGHLRQTPCFLTEHGIYTNERQVEITLADWIEYQKNFSLQLEKSIIDFDLKDFWMGMFEEYAHICYESCDEIITLYEGNKDLQIAQGAPAQKIQVIPNGIDYDFYSTIPRDVTHPPTIALIGRVVPIKDIETFIQACITLKETIPYLKAYIIGPWDEDRAYYEECVETVQYAGMEDTITFTGKVMLKDYLPIIDVCVLTSLSESQPLVLLEVGAAGIPSVTTDVGSCRELLYGKTEEAATGGNLKGGIVVEVGSPEAVAEGLRQLLTDKNLYTRCQDVMRKRVYQYYNKVKIYQNYRDLYNKYLQPSSARVA